MAATIAVATAFGGQNARCADDLVILGTTVPLSGAFRRNGIDTRNGYELAINQVNKKGGIVVGGKHYHLVARFYDDGSDPLSAKDFVERLIQQDDVKFILGPYHVGENRAVLTTVERNRVPMVDAHPVVRKPETPPNRYAFALAATPDQYFSPAIELAASISDRFGKAADDLRIAMATQNDPFSRQVRAGVLSDARRLGIQCVINDQLPENFSDMSATLDKVKALKPDLLLVSGHESTALSAAKQIKETGTEVPMVAMTHCASARLAQERPDSSQFVFCPVHWDRAGQHRGALFGSGEDFAKLFEEQYGYEPSSVAAQAAAAVYVFADAFDRANSLEPEKVRDAISETDLQTFFGPIKFDDRGMNSETSLMLTQVIDGDYVLIAPRGWSRHEPVIGK